jgi:hypothetical protein
MTSWLSPSSLAVTVPGDQFVVEGPPRGRELRRPLGGSGCLTADPSRPEPLTSHAPNPSIVSSFTP